VGASPREFLEPQAATLILSTTNGTRSILTAAARCDEVLLGSLLNLEALARATAERGEDVAVLCAGFQARSHSTMRTARAASSSGWPEWWGCRRRDPGRTNRPPPLDSRR
jgi:hypothetical protein